MPKRPQQVQRAQLRQLRAALPPDPTHSAKKVHSDQNRHRLSALSQARKPMKTKMKRSVQVAQRVMARQRMALPSPDRIIPAPKQMGPKLTAPKPTQARPNLPRHLLLLPHPLQKRMIRQRSLPLKATRMMTKATRNRQP